MLPVTDALCEKHGLEKLVYDRERKKGESYAEHLAKKEGRLSHSDVIRADIDAAVMRSGSYADFISAMRSMGYEIREGASEEHGAYLSYHAPGFARARRDYRLQGHRLLRPGSGMPHFFQFYLRMRMPENGFSVTISSSDVITS